jgi:hypothetical protein
MLIESDDKSHDHDDKPVESGLIAEAAPKLFKD